jgi:hypothetical protein
MALWDVDVTECIERRVVVDAQTRREAIRAAATRAAWLDAGAGTTVAVEVDMDEVTPREAEPEGVDCLDAYKYQEENREQ